MALRGPRWAVAWGIVATLAAGATSVGAAGSQASGTKEGTGKSTSATPGARGRAKPAPVTAPAEEPGAEPVIAFTTAAELAGRLAREARAPEAVFEVPGTEWRLRIASVAVSISGGDVVISLVPDPDIGSIRIRGRPSLVGRNAWRAERLQVSVDTPILAEQLETWIAQQIRGTEPRSLDAIFGPSAAFSRAVGAASEEPARVLPLASEIRAGRLEPQALTVEGAAIRLAAELRTGAVASKPPR